MKKLCKHLGIAILFVLLSSCDVEKSSTTENKPVSQNIVPEATEFKPLDTTYIRKLLGQQVYVPIYSSISNLDNKNLLHMTAILSIRNTSFKESITIKKIDYYDTNGKLIKQFIDRPFSLGKMSTKDFVIHKNDLGGGTGANFIVEWSSDKMVSIPLIESVMLGTQGTHGFSFSARGKKIEAH